MLTSHFLLSLPIAIFQQHYTVKMTATVFVSETEHCAVVWHFTLFVGGPCFPQLCISIATQYKLDSLGTESQ